MTRRSGDEHDVRVARFVVPPTTFILARGGALELKDRCSEGRGCSYLSFHVYAGTSLLLVREQEICNSQNARTHLTRRSSESTRPTRRGTGTITHVWEVG
jgi:hypothetical protein